MKTLSTPIEVPACEGTFLLPTDIPANLLRLKPGDKVRVLRYRPVRRVGYRLTARDFKTQASQLVDSDEFHSAWTALNKAAGCNLARHDMQAAVAYAMCAKAKCGGEWRGVVVDDDRWNFAYGTVWTVKSTRRVQTGKRYPPQSWRDSFTGDCDYDPGGLSCGKTVILVSIVEASTGLEVMSGDLERA